MLLKTGLLNDMYIHGQYKIQQIRNQRAGKGSSKSVRCQVL